ncbi:MAG: protease complex subunit PrcB family protein [Planctomycetes bacterium]|nr:protease complex subunit PrcB family protein [Planctomycetota bacterium]
MRSILRWGGAAAALLFILGFGSVAGAHTFTTGYYTATGTVQPLGISIYMQGSHKLVAASGSTLCLLTSTRYELEAFEGDTVKVNGYTTHTVEGHAQIMRVSSLTVQRSSRNTLLKTVLASGAHTSFSAPGGGANYALRDAATYARFWALLQPGETAPPVDFSRHMVLALFQGVQSSSGYSIPVDKVQRSGNRTFVTYRRVAPAPGAIALTVLTNPFTIVRVTRAGGSVFFNDRRADDLVMETRLTVSGRVTAGTGIDRSKVRVGTFSMNTNARYFQWPGNMPGDITALAADGSYSKSLRLDLPVGPEQRLYVIVWEEREGDTVVGGAPRVVSPGYYFESGSWHTEAGDTYAAGSTVRRSVTLTTTSN